MNEEQPNLDFLNSDTVCSGVKLSRTIKGDESNITVSRLYAGEIISQMLDSRFDGPPAVQNEWKHFIFEYFRGWQIAKFIVCPT